MHLQVFWSLLLQADSEGLTLITWVKGDFVSKTIYDYAALLNGLKSNYWNLWSAMDHRFSKSWGTDKGNLRTNPQSQSSVGSRNQITHWNLMKKTVKSQTYHRISGYLISWESFKLSQGDLVKNLFHRKDFSFQPHLVFQPCQLRSKSLSPCLYPASSIQHLASGLPLAYCPLSIAFNASIIENSWLSKAYLLIKNGIK